MYKFNKDGIQVSSETLSNGGIISKTWIWPWRRVAVSSGCAYQVTSGTFGGPLSTESYQDGNLGVMKARARLSEKLPKVTSFLLSEALLNFLTLEFPRGLYLVCIPSDAKVRDKFWTRLGTTDNDCYVLDVENYNGSLRDLAVESAKAYPGRYLILSRFYSDATLTEIDV